MFKNTWNLIPSMLSLFLRSRMSRWQEPYLSQLAVDE